MMLDRVSGGEQMSFGKWCAAALWMGGSILLCSGAARAQQYDMILQGGHVLDAKNHVDAVEDVAVKDGLVAEVAPHIDPKQAVKTIDVKGFYITPGLVDIHEHVYAGTGERGSYA